MSLRNYISRQLKKPTGLFGQIIMTRLLNRGNRIMNEKTLEHLLIQPNDHILEVGFGGGDLLNRILPEIQTGSVAGVDHSRDMVHFCIQRFKLLLRHGKLNLLCAPAERLPFADKQFTKLCTVNTLYFWENPQQVLAEFHRVLRDKGLLVLCFGDKESMIKNPLTQNNFTLYGKEQVEELLREAGFQDIHITRYIDRKSFFYCATGIK